MNRGLETGDWEPESETGRRLLPGELPCRSLFDHCSITLDDRRFRLVGAVLNVKQGWMSDGRSFSGES